MKKIALIGGITNNMADIPAAYFDAVSAVGAAPFAVYPASAKKVADTFDALLVCGGKDPHPALYGKKIRFPRLTKTEEKVDKYELPLINAFLLKNKPILGICRGAQSLNIALGGTLFEDIPTQLSLQHSDVTHEIRISRHSILYELFGASYTVNSHHHQSVERVGRGLFVSAASPDGIIEGIESEDGRRIGVQWHPERMQDMRPLFSYFVSLT